MTEKPKSTAPHPVFRLAIKAGVAMGPGKAALLRELQSLGSITAAAAALDMSYRRAWTLVESMNEQFKGPLVEKLRGGHGKGGTVVTPLGIEVLKQYEAMQAEAERAIARQTRAFGKLLK
jgi:molybdate transport system regulatory protein